MVGARGASLDGPYGAAVKAHACVAVDESRSKLAARCMSFYHIVCLSVCLEGFLRQANITGSRHQQFGRPAADQR